MIIDSSAVVAVVQDEPEGPAVLAALRAARLGGSRTLLSAATFVELGIVVDGRRNPVLSRRVDDLLRDAAVDVASFDAEQAAVARQAYRDYGKGSGHPARLNLGDCFSYALASVRREPLLFVGDDFTHTDIRSVL